MIQTNTESRAADGGVSDSWADTVTVRAQVKPQSGSEFMKALQVYGEFSHVVFMRYWSTGLTRSHRLKFGTRILDIVAVINVNEQNRDLIVTCKEQT